MPLPVRYLIREVPTRFKFLRSPPWLTSSLLGPLFISTKFSNIAVKLSLKTRTKEFRNHAPFSIEFQLITNLKAVILEISQHLNCEVVSKTTLKEENIMK
jgi:hypothetical protein